MAGARHRTPTGATRRTAVCCLAVAGLVAGCSGTGAGSGEAAPSQSPTGSSSAGSPSSQAPAAPSNPGGLTDAQMVGQLFMPYVYGSGARQATAAQRAANLGLYGAPTPATVIRRWHLGGVMLIDHNTLDPQRAYLSTGNVDGAAQIARLTAGMQRAARADGDPPLLVSTDQEGGLVQRIRYGVDARPSQLSLAHLSAAALRCSYYHLGTQLRALGVNQDFAPDADVVRTSTGVIGDRSFGPDPALDARDATAAVSGLQGAGVLATLKHWPGHGSTSTDSHLALAVVHESAATWRSVDRVPFARAARHAAAIMVGHLAVPALDPTGRPATFSPTLNRRLLRHDLGYRGLVVTDSLWMAPARQQGPPGRTALKALAAGSDVLLMPPALPRSYRGVLHAVRTDPRAAALVRAAAARVLAAKAQVGRGPGPAPAC